MSNDKIECYIVPSLPMPILLPIECVAEVVKKPQIEKLSKAPAAWMVGHVTWQNQRLPLMSFSSLLGSKLAKSKETKPCLIVLNPIPGAARKAYSGLLGFGDVKTIKVDKKAKFTELPEQLDKRYIESVVRIGKKDFIIPKLASLAVAFTYLS